MSAATAPPTRGQRRAARRWFWGGFVVVILVAALYVAFAAIRGAQQWAAAQVGSQQQPASVWSEVVRITLSGGEQVHVDAATLRAIHAETNAWIGARAREVEDRLSADLDQALEPVRARTLAQVPAFADWYYSLKGEYARLLRAAVGDLPQFMVTRMQEHIFTPAQTDQAFAVLTEDMNGRLSDALRTTAGETRRLVVRLVREHAVVPTTEAQVRVVGAWTLDEALAARIDPFLSLSHEDLARQGVAATVGAAAAAAALKKLGAGLVGKLGAKAAGGALAGAGAGAATGAALCGSTVVGAPLALGCAAVGGAVAGIGTWLLVDKAVLEAEEWLQREAFEAQLSADIDQALDALRAALRDHYATGTRAAFGQLEQAFEALFTPTGATPERDFVPARAAAP